jgi:hypothetical protein
MDAICCDSVFQSEHAQLGFAPVDRSATSLPSVELHDFTSRPIAGLSRTANHFDIAIHSSLRPPKGKFFAGSD